MSFTENKKAVPAIGGFDILEVKASVDYQHNNKQLQSILKYEITFQTYRQISKESKRIKILVCFDF